MIPNNYIKKHEITHAFIMIHVKLLKNEKYSMHDNDQQERKLLIHISEIVINT